MYDKAALQARINAAWDDKPRGRVNWAELEHVVRSILESTYVPMADKPAMIGEALGAFTGRGVPMLGVQSE